MIHYYSHGINILSEIFFPEFISTKSTSTDVTIRFGKIYKISKDFKESNLSKFIKIKFTSKIINVLYNDFEIFSIVKSSEIIVNEDTKLDENFLRYLVIGHALPILLYKKGRLVLHANAININNKAVVLLGVSGTGKSTTSLALYKKGYKIISDDILSIKINNSHPIVYPGFPKIKLWPQVILKFKEDPQKYPKVHPKTKKRFYSVTDNFTHHNKQIQAIYLIRKSEKNEITKMDIFDSMLELIKSSYCYKLFDENDLSNNLKQITQIVNKVPVKMLKIENSFDFYKLIQMLEYDLLDIN